MVTPRTGTRFLCSRCFHNVASLHRNCGSHQQRFTGEMVGTRHLLDLRRHIGVESLDTFDVNPQIVEEAFVFIETNSRGDRQKVDTQGLR